MSPPHTRSSLTDTLKWTRFEPMTASEVPEKRMGHTATIVEDDMYMFGCVYLTVTFAAACNVAHLLVSWL